VGLLAVGCDGGTAATPTTVAAVTTSTSGAAITSPFGLDEARAEFVDARRRWESTGVGSYMISYSQSTFAWAGDYVVEVHDGMGEIVLFDGEGPVGSLHTIGSFFDLIERLLDEGTWQFTFVYHPDGSPLAITADGRGSDDRLRYTGITVTPIEAAATDDGQPTEPDSIPVDYGDLPMDLAGMATDMGLIMVRGEVTETGDDSITFGVFDTLTASYIEGWVTGAVVTVPTDLPGIPQSMVDDLAEAVASSAEPVPVMLLVGKNAEFQGALPLDESLIRFSRDRTSEPRVLYSFSNGLALGVDHGLIRYTTASADPDQFSYCQDLPRIIRYESVTGDEVADVLAFGLEMTRPDPSPDQVSRSDAEHLAQQTIFIDEITGLSTSGWVTDVADQAMRSVPYEDLVVHRTVPVRLRQGGFGWQTQIVVLAEAGTGRVLGWWDGNPTAKTRATEVMVPPTGADLEVYRRDWTVDPNICVGGNPYMVIPYDQVAGSRRAIINLVSRSFRDWDGP